MIIQSVFDPEFRHYGQVVTGFDAAVEEILPVLSKTPLPEGVTYVAEEPTLQNLPCAQAVSQHLYGGMPVELGFCNGHNTRLNCLEYHRDSECNLGTEDFILLLARQDELENGVLDTGKVKAFRVPAGVLVEVYATTLHYAPCHCDPRKGFQVLIVLPKGTNGPKPEISPLTPEDHRLWAKNKWLLAHPDSDEARQGAYLGLTGENPDIGGLI